MALLAAIALIVPSQATGTAKRDPAERAAFMKLHPCPATGKTRGACPGYVVDHVKPLCAGGRDHPSNMQWQTRAEARIKDRQERQMCRAATRVR